MTVKDVMTKTAEEGTLFSDGKLEVYDGFDDASESVLFIRTTDGRQQFRLSVKDDTEYLMNHYQNLPESEQPEWYKMQPKEEDDDTQIS